MSLDVIVYEKYLLKKKIGQSFICTGKYFPIATEAVESRAVVKHLPYCFYV